MRTYILPFAEEDAKVRLMFEDEASFGRISEPSSCWAPHGIRPVVLCQMVREYMYVYGAVDPISGDDCFLTTPKCNTECTNIFLEQLSKRFNDDYILLCMDRASWHRSIGLVIPDNIILFHIPPRTPEMNPIEQIWPEVRYDFKNKLFNSLSDVEDQLCISIHSMTNDLVKSVTGRDWIVSMF
jgi:transposase